MKRIFKNAGHRSAKPGFTIVELLVVIVIIGVLAAVIIVSYVGMAQKAKAAVIVADLKNATTQLEVDKANAGTYPITAAAANNGSGLKTSSGTVFDYKYYAGIDAYSLVATDVSNNSPYYVTSSNSTPVNGSVPSFYSFAKTLGGTGTDYGNSIIQVADGGYIIAGTTNSYGAGNSDVLISKYDAIGNVVWNKTWGGAGKDVGYSIIKASDGGYLVSGNTSSYGAGNDDIFLIKYDASFNVVWNKTWGGAGNDWNNNTIQTSDGGYVVTGCTMSYGAGGGDVFLIKYDASGTVVWNKTWGGSNYDFGSSLAQTSDGGYIVTGKTYSFGSGDALLIKYDASGTVVWNKTWGGTGDDGLSSVVIASDGGYVVTGGEGSYGAGDSDVVLIKYSASGSLVWNKAWGGIGYDYGQSIIKTTDNGYVVTGYTISYGAGGYDSFTTKYDTNGDLSWNKTWGGPGDDFGVSLVQTSDNGYAETGQTSLGAGGIDMSFVKFSDSGTMTNCPTTMCQTLTSNLITPSASTGAPAATIKTPTATIKTPTATKLSPVLTTTVLVSL